MIRFFTTPFGFDCVVSNLAHDSLHHKHPRARLRLRRCTQVPGPENFGVRIPALGDRRITVEVKLIATKGEYASWRATRATGDFNLRTFSIRAYSVDKVPELHPGMSAYTDWRTGQ